MSSQYTGSSDTQASARLYELETTVSQIRDASAKTQQDHTRLEKRHNLALTELQDLQKSHSRLEQQYFETERQLQAASAQLDKAQRGNATLASQLEAKTRDLEVERERGQRRESELAEQLAVAKKKVTLQRRQTVTLGAPARTSSVGGNGGRNRMSMFAHDAPMSPPSPAFAERLGFSEDHDDREVRRLQMKLRDAEGRAARMEGAAEQVRREAQLVAADLAQSQRKCDKLEVTVKQLNELNEGLREDNESYQMLLQMGTIKGGFKLNSGRGSFESRKYSMSPDETPSPARSTRNDLDNPLAQLDSFSGEHSTAGGAGLDLAAELDQALSVSGSSKAAELEDQLTRLKEELRKTKYERRHLADENKALSLYVNKILGRILASTDGLEAVLARDYDASALPKRSSSSSTPSVGSPIQRSTTVSTRSPVVQQRRHHGRTRSTFSPSLREAPPVPDMSTFPVRGSGDGITSVFVPPTSPSVQSGAQFSPPPVKNPERFTGRARSATHSAGMAPVAQPEQVPVPRPNASGAQAGGTWWKRMSVRIGGGWNVQDGPDQPAVEQ